ncbi:golgi-body localization protein domain-containing protein [Radiomyces spectabilis]|uniref:golgi-body localization protein domain-containing protein n=1 Tax=Radiomyces spectabilis TaxID=64574 RepID=UPI00221F0F39|nr:golgi-body localization protein domain-containing protein [Radiomyces spectabilis]KAI8379699.1 golgi-body localization protein domain-containing protein [Radiomyces spectabilis]
MLFCYVLLITVIVSFLRFLWYKAEPLIFRIQFSRRSIFHIYLHHKRLGWSFELSNPHFQKSSRTVSQASRVIVHLPKLVVTISNTHETPSSRTATSSVQPSISLFDHYVDTVYSLPYVERIASTAIVIKHLLHNLAAFCIRGAIVYIAQHVEVLVVSFTLQLLDVNQTISLRNIQFECNHAQYNNDHDAMENTHKSRVAKHVTFNIGMDYLHWEIRERLCAILPQGLHVSMVMAIGFPECTPKIVDSTAEIHGIQIDKDVLSQYVRSIKTRSTAAAETTTTNCNSDIFIVSPQQFWYLSNTCGLRFSLGNIDIFDTGSKCHIDSCTVVVHPQFTDQFAEFEANIMNARWQLTDGKDDWDFIVIRHVQWQGIVGSKLLLDDTGFLPTQRQQREALINHKEWGTLCHQKVTFSTTTAILTDPTVNLHLARADFIQRLLMQQVTLAGNTSSSETLPHSFSIMIALTNTTISFHDASVSSISDNMNLQTIQLQGAGRYALLKRHPNTTQVESHPREWWTKLLRRKNMSQIMEIWTSTLASTDWAYTVRLALDIDKCCGKIKKTPIFHVKHIHLGTQANLRIGTAGLHSIPTSILGHTKNPPLHIQATITNPRMHLTNDVIFHIEMYQQWISNVMKGLTSGVSLNESSAPSSQTPSVWVLLSTNNVLSLTIVDASFSLSDVDKRCRQAKEIPHLYVNNAPQQDLAYMALLSVEQLYIHIDGTSAKIDERNSIPVMQCCMQEFAVTHRMAKWEDQAQLEKSEKDQLLLWISDITVNLATQKSEADQGITIEVAMPRLGCSISIANIYGCFLIFHFTEKLFSQLTKLRSPSKSTEIPTSNGMILRRLSFYGQYIDVRILLPFNKHLHVQTYDLRIRHRRSLENNVTVNTTVNNFALLGTAPGNSKLWEQLIGMQEIAIANADAQFPSTVYSCSLESLQLRLPYGYVVADVIDSTITMIKSCKVFWQRFMDRNELTFMGPVPRNDPLLLPRISVHCKNFTAQLDDSPFESRLRRILRLGLQEQIKRLESEQLFDKKARSMTELNSLYNEQYQSTEPDDLTPSSDSYLSSSSWGREKRSSHSSSHSKRLSFTTSTQDIWNRLQEHHAQSWVLQIKEAIQAEAKAYIIPMQQAQNFIHQTRNKSKTASDWSLWFRIRITRSNACPPLVRLQVSRLQVDVAAFDDATQDIRQFMHDIGNGVPPHIDVALLLPFFVNASAGETWVRVRDYPLPLVYIPTSSAPCDRSDEFVQDNAWSLSASCVVADDLGTSDGVRCVPLVLVPECYTLQAIRVASPLKFYSKIECNVYTDGLSTICWSVSYHPAIQDMVAILDTMLPASVDPSPSIGIWDKLRLILHTQTTIQFPGNGDLAIVMKGTYDPYSLDLCAAGMTKLWREHIVVYIGSNMRAWVNHPIPTIPADMMREGDILQISSREYYFGIPDIARGGYAYFTEHSVISVQGKYQESQKYRFAKMVVKLSGPLCMSIGCELERTKCTVNGSQDSEREIRTKEFRKHFEITYKTVDNVKKLTTDGQVYDAFAGFRSQYIHLTIRIMTLYDRRGRGISPNIMYLNPYCVDHFGVWFGLFRSPIRLPIRHGALFSKAAKDDKNSAGYLDSINYCVQLQPFLISYFYRDESLSLVEGTNLVGLKALMERFDLRVRQQRSQHVENEQQKLGLSVHQVYLEMKTVDLRAIDVWRRMAGEKRRRNGQEGEHSFIMNPTMNDWIDDHDSVGFHDFNEDPSHWCATAAQVHRFVFSPYIFYQKMMEDSTSTCTASPGQPPSYTADASADTYLIQVELLNARQRRNQQQWQALEKSLAHIESQLASHKDNEMLLEQRASILEKMTIVKGKSTLFEKYRETLSTHSACPVKDSTNMFQPTDHKREPHEKFVGSFLRRFIVHDSQIIWTNAIRNIIYRYLDLRTHCRFGSYIATTTALRAMENLLDQSLNDTPWKPQSPSTGHRLDKETVNQLIESLLETQHNAASIADNENGNEPANEARGMEFVAGGKTSNEKRSEEQLPDGYYMKQRYLVELLNPQIHLDNGTDSDYILLLSSQRMQIEGLDILDDMSRADVEPVKKRMVVDSGDLQLYLAKKQYLCGSDLFLGDTYLDKVPEGQTSTWYTWISPEILRFSSTAMLDDRLTCITRHLTGSLTYDKHNYLHISKSNSIPRHTAIEETSDTVDMQFPSVSLVADALCFREARRILLDLVPYSDPRRKGRLERIQDMILSNDQACHGEMVLRMTQLHSRIRHLLLHQQQLQSIPVPMLDWRRYRRNSRMIEQCKDDLYVMMEAVKSMQSQIHQQRRKNVGTRLRVIFNANHFLWQMNTKDDQPLCHAALSFARYTFAANNNGTKSHVFEINDLEIQNLTPQPTFITVLERNKVCDQPSAYSLIRLHCTLLPPVGGIAIVQHLELNLPSLKLQFTHSFISALVAYFANSGTSTIPQASEQRKSSLDRSITHGMVVSHSEEAFSERDTETCSDSDEGIWFGASRKRPPFSTLPGTTNRSQELQDDQLSIMKSRASANWTFLLVKIPGNKHCLSFQGPKKRNLYDLREFRFFQPSIEYRNKAGTWTELLLSIKKDFIRAAIRANGSAILKEAVRQVARRASSESFIEKKTTDSGSQEVDVDSASQLTLTATTTAEELITYLENLADSSDEEMESHSVQGDNYEDYDDEEALQDDAVSLHSVDILLRETENEISDENTDINSHPGLIRRFWTRLRKRPHIVKNSSCEPPRTSSDETPNTASDEEINSLRRTNRKRSSSSVKSLVVQKTDMTYLEKVAKEEYDMKARMLLGRGYSGSRAGIQTQTDLEK